MGRYRGRQGARGCTLSPERGEYRQSEGTLSEALAGPTIIGHRGAAGHAPENTLSAFAAGLALGVDGVEFDVQFTSDGVPVVLHDETLERMAGVRARVSDHTEAALRGFDLGFRSGPAFRGQRLPRVEDVARLVSPPVELHAELKDYLPPGEREIRSLAGALERNGGLARVVISSPHEETLAEVRRLVPAARRALLLFRSTRSPVDAARRAAFLGCHAVNPNASLALPELVDVCHRHNMRVLAFTVNERGTMRELVQNGVDGFFTDFPDRLRPVAA
ncbi:MAG TPA: glycerophosphodiester phosphodiesterase family protein [Candidatus Polarisedimenticolia bacterium]|nr:glycerophosphodiester phosphodiesterase family protein [Candidatus Polarisedimenticolia bacterium]